jgi:hypothetical protein
MNFYIKKNSTLPVIKLEVVKNGRNDYNNFMDMIEVSSIFFSMVDVETGIPKITSRPGGFVEKTSMDPNAEPEYYIYYQFTSKDTNRVGRYEGEFMLRNSDGVLILPIREKLNINVQESFIADDLVYDSCYVSEFPCCVNELTPTPTPTNTETPTPTPTNTETPTPTPTNTETPTPTPTQTPTMTPTPTPPSTLGLRLTFDDIANADLLVGDSSSVEDWNTFFDLPTYGNPFTSVEVVGNEVSLIGGSNIKVKPALMYDYNYNTFLISVVDTANCITSVGGDAFTYCYGLTTVDLPACTIAYGWQDSPQNDYGAFGECVNLINLNLPLLTTAGYSCFAYCTSLTAIDLPLLTTAGDYCFAYCTSLTTVDLPLLTTAGYGCFAYCTSLTAIDLPLLTTAGDYCFAYCTSLTAIDLPLLTTAGYYCFYDCTSLTTIDLPLLTTAGDYCFYDCTSLTTIDLPLLTTAGYYCFYACTSLTTISLPACTDLGGTVLDNDVFNSIMANTITLTVPSTLMTCNSGSPDGDIQYLQVNNTVTIITI